MSTRVFGLLPLAKSLKPQQRINIETSLSSAAALATACGIVQRSRALEKNHMFKFSYKGRSIRNIRKLAPYENFPLYSSIITLD